MSEFEMNVSPENITALYWNEIFVFGSNLSGIHGGGAAKTALKWGAIPGKDIGLMGNTYGIPTKSEGIKRSLTIDEIKLYVDDFIEYAKNMIDDTFLVTEIGCGLAGHSPENIAPLFMKVYDEQITNIYLPIRFINIIENLAKK